MRDSGQVCGKEDNSPFIRFLLTLTHLALVIADFYSLKCGNPEQIVGINPVQNRSSNIATMTHSAQHLVT